MKNVALFLCMTFVGSMALTATSFANTSASEGWGTVNICQEKPCPKDCKCDKCAKAASADKDSKACCKKADDKSCCAKDNKDAKSCSKSETSCQKKCEKSETKSTDTKTTEPEKK